MITGSCQPPVKAAQGIIDKVGFEFIQYPASSYQQGAKSGQVACPVSSYELITSCKKSLFLPCPHTYAIL